eukprot:gene1239-biopygen1229
MPTSFNAGSSFVKKWWTGRNVGAGFATAAGPAATGFFCACSSWSSVARRLTHCRCRWNTGYTLSTNRINPLRWLSGTTAYARAVSPFSLPASEVPSSTVTVRSTCITRSSRLKSSFPFSRNVYRAPSLPQICIFFGRVFDETMSTVWSSRVIVTDSSCVPGTGTKLRCSSASGTEMSDSARHVGFQSPSLRVLLRFEKWESRVPWAASTAASMSNTLFWMPPWVFSSWSPLSSFGSASSTCTLSWRHCGVALRRVRCCSMIWASGWSSASNFCRLSRLNFISGAECCAPLAGCRRFRPSGGVGEGFVGSERAAADVSFSSEPSRARTKLLYAGRTFDRACTSDATTALVCSSGSSVMRINSLTNRRVALKQGIASPVAMLFHKSWNDCREPAFAVPRAATRG